MLTPEEHRAQAAEILSQLGGGKFIAMTGAKYITYDGDLPAANLSLRFMGSRKANHIKIVLNAMDTYDVTFYKIGKYDFKVVSEHTDIYNDMLQELFTDVTGLHTTLGTLGR